MNKNKKIIIWISIVLVIVLLSSVGTYAWYVWSTSDDEVTEIATGVGAATVIYDAGANMIGQSIKPVADKTSGLIKNITIQASKSMSSTMTFNLYLDITTLDEGLKDQSFRYEIYKSSTLKKSGNFSQESLDTDLVECTSNNTSHIVLLENEAISTTQSSYTLYLWVDGANYTNPDTMQNQNFSFKLHAEGTNAIIREAKYPDITAVKEGTLAYNIVNTYNNSNKTVVTNGSTRYNYDTVHNLMSDVGGNVRYYGATPNNYIYFNCSDYSNQSSSTCEIWRIIGVFGDKVKIIRNESIGDLAWDYDKNDDSSKTSYDNNWSTATLQKLLNTSYYNGTDTVTYYNSSSSTVTLDMSDIGIKNGTTRNMIASTSWNLGELNTSSIFSDQIYGYEKGTKVYSGRPTSWSGKIALMYPSDYGYAVDFNLCKQTLRNYDNSTCIANNWLYINKYQWLLTPNSQNSNNAWSVRSSGVVDYYLGYEVYGARPVLYLSSELEIETGDGSSESPYKLST